MRFGTWPRLLSHPFAKPKTPCAAAVSRCFAAARPARELRRSSKLFWRQRKTCPGRAFLSAQRSRVEYFPVAHISCICLCLSRLPPGRLCLAFAAAFAVCLRHATDPTPDAGCLVSPSINRSARLLRFQPAPVERQRMNKRHASTAIFSVTRPSTESVTSPCVPYLSAIPIPSVCRRCLHAAGW